MSRKPDGDTISYLRPDGAYGFSINCQLQFVGEMNNASVGAHVVMLPYRNHSENPNLTFLTVSQKS